MQAVYWIGEKSELVLGEASFNHMEEFSVTDATHNHRSRFLVPMHIQTTSNRKEMFLDELIRKYEMLRELSVILVNSVAAAQRAHRSLTCRFELTATRALLRIPCIRKACHETSRFSLYQDMPGSCHILNSSVDTPLMVRKATLIGPYLDSMQFLFAL